MAKPKIIDDPMYRLLRDEKIEQFNTLRKDKKEVHFEGLDFRGLDLRGMNAENIIFSDSYFRQTDLRGLDLSTCQLEGASICNAKISGTYFPKRLTAQEIMMSLSHGTRMRYRVTKNQG